MSNFSKITKKSNSNNREIIYVYECMYTYVYIHVYVCEHTQNAYLYRHKNKLRYIKIKWVLGKVFVCIYVTLYVQDR